MKAISRILIQTIFILFSSLLLISYLSPFIPPEKLWWLSFLGLAYPILLLFTIFSLLFSIWKKWKLVYLFLLIFIIGLPFHYRFFGMNISTSEPEETSSFRLMSQNVRLFNLYDHLSESPKTIKDSIIGRFQSISPDVLCIQEYLSDHNSNPFIHKKEIEKAGNWKHSFEHIVWKHQNRDYGIATFSRYPILESGKIENPSNNKVFSIYTDLLIDTDTIRLYNVHLESIRLQKEEYQLFDHPTEISNSTKQGIKSLARKILKAYEPRVQQTRSIVKHMEQSPYPVIICGDFNDTPISYVYQQFNSFLNDAFIQSGFGIGGTYAGRVPAGRIDYIFYAAPIQSTQFNVDRVKLSDHYAIWTDLTLVTAK